MAEGAQRVKAAGLPSPPRSRAHRPSSRSSRSTASSPPARPSESEHTEVYDVVGCDRRARYACSSNESGEVSGCRETSIPLGPNGRSSAQRPAPGSQPTRLFGSAGQVVISDDTQISFYRQSFSVPGGGSQDPTWQLTLGPSLDLFVVRNLSIGAAFTYEHSDDGSLGSLDTLAIAPRVGFNVWLTGASELARDSTLRAHAGRTAIVPRPRSARGSSSSSR